MHCLLRIHFKVLLMVFKSLNRMALSILSELLSVHIHSRTLRLANHVNLRGDQAFAVVVPRL